MKYISLSVLTFIFFISCQKQEQVNIDTKHLNGYWEIEQVTTADGSKTEYKVNETFDYFEVKNDSGFRKKVTPQLDGTYLVNDSDEKIKIEKSSDGTFILYKTAYATWKEKIKSLNEAQLTLENEQKIQYQYKKPIPFSNK